MIIFEDKGFQTRSDKPDSDWTGKAKYIVPDGTELANKIISLYPWYDFIIDENGDLTDVVEVEHEVDEPEIKPVKKKQTAKCPECGGELVFEGGCNTCKDCGYSKCS